MAEKLDFQAFPLLKEKSARRDSNPRPRPWQGRAPPTEPLAHIYLMAFTVTNESHLIMYVLILSSQIIDIFDLFFEFKFMN